jgi:hypothetical protein
MQTQPRDSNKHTKLLALPLNVTLAAPKPDMPAGNQETAMYARSRDLSDSPKSSPKRSLTVLLRSPNLVGAIVEVDEHYSIRRSERKRMLGTPQTRIISSISFVCEIQGGVSGWWATQDRLLQCCVVLLSVTLTLERGFLVVSLFVPKSEKKTLERIVALLRPRLVGRGFNHIRFRGGAIFSGWT